MSDSNYMKATDAIEAFRSQKDRHDEPMVITPPGPMEAGPKTLQAAEAIMKSAEKNDHLELAEKALEVMGFECIGIDRDTAHRRFYKEFCSNVILKSTSPLSNDLAAEGKRWLLDSEHRLSIDLFERDGERLAYVVVFSDDNMQWVRTYDVEAPTENEAVLRAIIEIGKKD